MTIFQKIIDGEIPCHKVYEDDNVLAFLDVSPLSRGHTLVIPKEAKPSLHELSQESAAALGRALVKISQAIVNATGISQYNILQNNGADAHQAVFHVHFHIIPKPSQEEGLGIVWNPIDQEEAQSLAESIRQAL